MGKFLAILGEYGRHWGANRHLFLLPLCIGFLTVLGLLTLSSASLSFVGANYLFRQCLWLAIALPVCGFCLLLPVEFLHRRSSLIFIAAIFLLCIVLIPGIGRSVNGSRRWLDLGFFHFQVSEFAKFALILHLSDHLTRHSEQPPNFFRDFLLPLAFIGILAGLLLLEPDYGATFLFLLVGFTLLFLNGLSIHRLLACGAVAGVLFAAFIAMNPVRLGRILSFLDIESTKLTGSYQLWQGLIGFHSGGLHGLGLGNGRQQLFYLPEAHTDFIFPVFAEEWGYVYALLVVLAYLIIFSVAWAEIYRIHNRFLFLFCNGLLLFLTTQTLINLAVVMGLFPTKGMALPLISYGGSNLIFVFASLGLLFNCFRTAYFEKPSVENCH
jgi:cell division protein FtsW